MPGYEYDPARGERVIEFLEKCVTLSEGKWAGELIQLLEWQKEIVRSIYGWHSDGVRRYQRAAIWVAKKNGKSALAAGLALYHLLADGEKGPTIALAARDRNQARIIFRSVAAAVNASPWLSDILEVVDYRGEIIHRANNGRIIAMSREKRGAEGISCSAVILDELHVADRGLVEALVYSGAAREQPLCLSISTAGVDQTPDAIGWQWWQDSRLVEKNPAVIPRMYAKIYAADNDDNLEDPETWRKANPSMCEGGTIKEDAYKAELLDAMTSPSKLGAFKRYRLNIWTTAGEAFIDPDRWNDCGGRPEFEDGDSVYIGIDLASHLDMTAAAVIKRDEDGIHHIMPIYWIPEESVALRERETGYPYSEWIRTGHLRVTPGARLDHEAVALDLIELHERFNVYGIASDPWQLGSLASYLQREDIEVQAIRQNTSTLSAPMKHFEGLIAERKIRHGNHPILDMNSKNALVFTDATGLVKPDKNKSRGLIDGIVACVNGFALALEDAAGDDLNVDDWVVTRIV